MKGCKRYHSKSIIQLIIPANVTNLTI